MTTIEHVKGHIDILKYVKEQRAMTCCTYGQRRDCEPKPTGGPVLLLQSEPENTVTFNRPCP